MNSAELMSRYGIRLALFGDGTVTGPPLQTPQPVLDATPPTEHDAVH